MIYFRDEGRGPVLLLLHALPYDSRTWRNQIEHFSRRCRVLAPDCPGFGRSPPPGGPIGFDSLAAALLEELTGKGVRRAVVAGNSMGGYLAFALFRAAPDFFSGFCLVNSRAAADDAAARRRRLELVDRARREGLSFLREGAPEQAKAMVEDATVEGYAAAQRAIAERPDSTSLLPAIRVPSSVIWGLDDPLVPVTEAESMVRALPDCAFEPIVGAGHVPMLEQPNGVTEALERLVARCGGFS